MSQPNIDLQEASANNSGGNAEVKSVELKANLATNSQPTNYRWVILGFAFFITLVNYLDRTAISYAMEPMKKEFGFTVIFISHDLSVVRYISDRIMVMNKGKIEESGKADDIYFNPQSDYTKKLIASIPKGVPIG